MRFVSPLTEQEQDALRSLVHERANHRERMRAQAVLWSHKGYKIKQIADLCEVDRDTVSRWLKRWEADKEQGLPDGPRSGRPSILNHVAVTRRKKKLVAYADQAVRQVRQLVSYVARHFGKQVSMWTIKRILKAAGYCYKRMRRSLKSKRDEVLFAFFEEEIKHLEALEEQGELDLLLFR